MNLKQGLCMDLLIGWGFSHKMHQYAAERYIDRVRPLVVIGSPECKMFSALQNMTNEWSEERERTHQICNEVVRNASPCEDVFLT